MSDTVLVLLIKNVFVDFFTKQLIPETYNRKTGILLLPTALDDH